MQKKVKTIICKNNKICMQTHSKKTDCHDILNFNYWTDSAENYHLRCASFFWPFLSLVQLFRWIWRLLVYWDFLVQFVILLYLTFTMSGVGNNLSSILWNSYISLLRNINIIKLYRCWSCWRKISSYCWFHVSNAFHRWFCRVGSHRLLCTRLACTSPYHRSSNFHLCRSILVRPLFYIIINSL